MVNWTKFVSFFHAKNSLLFKNFPKKVGWGKTHIALLSSPLSRLFKVG
jgi:hypothetical protein